MAFPERRTLLNHLRTSARASVRRRGRRLGSGGWGPGGMSGLRRRNRGSALVVSLIAGLIALIGAFVLASRLFSSRFNSFSRNDTLAAREAAHFGLNELQAQLNTNQRSYLWLTRRNNWTNANLLAALNTCNVQALDSSGKQLTALPALPGGVTSAREIRSVNGATISYQLRTTDGFQPPELPDQDAATLRQEGPCGVGTANAAAAANFGNLNGGSAIITVVGTVSRGSGADAKTTNFTLSRRVHVATPGQELKFSFIILGNAYNALCTDGTTTLPKCTPDPDPITPTSFGSLSDASRLNVLDGNICYGTPSDCSTPLELTVIGCADLDSCIVNNVDTISGKTRNSFCAIKEKKKKKKSVVCNSFQQAGDLPPVFSLNAGAANNVGFWDYIDNNPSPFTNDSWRDWSKRIKCDTEKNDQKCPNVSGSEKKAKFPYITEGDFSDVPSNITNARARKNKHLVEGCYYNNTNGGPDATGSTSSAINCLYSEFKFDKKGSKNLLVYTKSSSSGNTLLPVNIFLGGQIDSKGKFSPGLLDLNNGGIQNIDNSINNWFNLRIIGHNIQSRNSIDRTQPISCDQQLVRAKKDDDINGAWIWLPNGHLNFEKTDSKDSSYNVVWTCQFTAPTKKDTNYKIITPKNLDAIVRSNLLASLPGFNTAAGGTYRAYGAEDALAF